jgi:hypothetical protein
MVATNLNTLSLPPAAASNALRDIKPPLEIANPWVWVAWLVTALALTAVLYWAWRSWQRKRALIPPVPLIPPHIRAKQKLQEALGLLGQPKEFCILVSDTVRWYLEEVFEFRAPERTTEEFLYDLQSTNLLTPDQKTSLGEFLTRCDLVKFAKYEPGEPELRELHAAALRLVEETEPLEQTPAPDVQHSKDSLGTGGHPPGQSTSALRNPDSALK